MASSTTNKYAGLPDIDLDQQDVYETPDILDDVSTVPTSISDDDNDEDIERRAFSIDAARQRFAEEHVDAEFADFSDTLIARQKKQSYRTSRQEIVSKPETLDDKIARVRREMEEIRLEMAHQKKPVSEIQEWESVMHSLTDEDHNNAIKHLTSRLSKLTTTMASQDDKSATSYTLTYSPVETTQLSTISSRLSTLESLLGLPLSQTSTPILPTIAHLTSKLNLLTSQSQIDLLAQRIKSLTTELTNLEEKREQARQRALLDPEDAPSNSTLEIDIDQTQKIDALYAALTTIDRVAPVIPGVLDRLRAMRIVHADAAGVTSGLKDVSARLERMEGEIKEWKEAIGKVEGGLRDVVGRTGGVAERVEGVILGLEERVKNLEM